MKIVLGSILLCASMANAANHVITVGVGGQLQFSPNQVTAAVSDTLEFVFASGVCFNFPV
jgi:plastocyanin